MLITATYAIVTIVFFFIFILTVSTAFLKYLVELLIN